MTDQEINDRILLLHGWRKVEKREWFEEQMYTDGNVVWRHRDMPNYSGDMRAAYELVLEMCSAKFSVNINTNVDASGIFCVCSMGDENLVYFVGVGETAPLAICKLYLAWKEGNR